MSWLLRPLQKTWLGRALSTTVGQKVLMGLTGLLLCGFLVVHLAGNLLMYRGPEHFDAYAEALHKNELLPLAEAGLLVLFVVHLCLAFSTAAQNRAARTVPYAVKESKLARTAPVPPHTMMLFTGIVVLVFLVLHLTDLRMAELALRLPYDPSLSPFEHVQRVLFDPLSAGVYAVGSVFVGLHVWHGFQSAFTSLGFQHPKYTPCLRRLSSLFAFVVAVGFASLPLYFYVFVRVPGQ